LVVQLDENGIEVMEARDAVLKWIRGQDSDLRKMINIER